jgi:hypothetical protein
MQRLTLFLTLGVLALVAALPASASTQPAAGAFVEGPEMNVEERFADGNLIFEFTRSVAITGTYTGVGEADERIVIHKDGSTNVHIVITFTGLACGQPAALVFLLTGQGQLDENFETGTVSGEYAVIDSGQTDDRTLRGNGTFTAEAGVAGTYEGQAHCD